MTAVNKEQSNSLQATPFALYGSLIHEWRNEMKQSVEAVEVGTGISVARMNDLEDGMEKPTWDELEKLARQFIISVRDLLPHENDTDRGIVSLRNEVAGTFEQERGGKKQYTYTYRAMTATLPNFKPVELVLHLSDKEQVVLNNGHFFHQYTQVLHGGPVGHVWEWEGKLHYEEFNPGDSWIIPGFVPHGFWSPDPENEGTILAITFGQHLASSDAKQEMTLIGAENCSKIFRGGNYFTS